MSETLIVGNGRGIPPGFPLTIYTHYLPHEQLLKGLGVGALLLVFESPVHATGKRPELNRTELRSSCFTVAVASDFAGDQLQFQ
jgi:hypothetical protein